MSSPLDLVAQHRAPLEFCPGYWPEHEPGKSLADFCYDEYLYGSRLYHDPRHNPFAIARQELERLNSDRAVAHRRLAAAVVHWWLGGRDAAAAHTTILAALAGENMLRDDIVSEVATRPLLKRMPATLWQVVPDPTVQAVDLGTCSSLSHDAVVNMPRMLQLAAARGLQGMVVADRGHVAGAQETARIAADLKREGLLPPEFEVTVGQHIDSLGTDLTAIGLDRRIPSGMTVNRTLAEIRRQGAAAVLNRPGRIGGSNLLRTLDVDGYFIQPGFFELFRTMSALYDPELADKPALYASHSRHTQLVGLPYSAVLSPNTETRAVVAALHRKDAFAASNLYFPLMAILVTKPVAAFETAMNNYFVVHDRLTDYTRRLMHADHIIITTTWDETVQDLMDLANTRAQIRAIVRGDSMLRHTPQITSVSAQYGAVQIEYRRDPEQFWVRSRLSF